jgi:hypothetical protein
MKIKQEQPSEMQYSQGFSTKWAQIHCPRGFCGNIQMKINWQKINFIVLHNYCTTSITERNAMNLSPHLSKDFWRMMPANFSIY